MKHVHWTGSVAVHRSGPSGTGGKAMVGDLVGASLHGTSKVFGEIVAMQNPTQHSPCEYLYEGPGRYKGHFDIKGWFWLPEHDLLIFTRDPVRVEGTAKGIPPVGQRAEITIKDVPLYDLRHPKGNPIGILSQASGEVLGLVRIEEHLKKQE